MELIYPICGCISLSRETYNGKLTIGNNQTDNAFFTAPVVSSPEQIHVVLTVKDNGKPELYSYRRIIITVNK